MRTTIGKCSVWVYGSVLGHAGWIENKILDVGEGFQNRDQAERWGKEALARLKSADMRPHFYRLGPAY